MLGATLRILLVHTLASAFILCAFESSIGKEWRGITPLRSTRADVLRLWNQCSEHKEVCRFETDKESVYVLFSGGLQDSYSDCGASLAPETVLFVELVPKGKLTLKDLSIDKKTLTSFQPIEGYLRDLKGYQTSDGLVMSMLKGSIVQLDYVPDEKERGSCVEFYQRPEPFIQTLSFHPPPPITLDCAELILNSRSNLIAKASLPMQIMRGPLWTVDKGRIVSGQFTHKLVVDTSGLNGQTVTVTAEIGDSLSHVTTASTCTLRIGQN
jgi:hypothetical protein